MGELCSAGREDLRPGQQQQGTTGTSAQGSRPAAVGARGAPPVLPAAGAWGSPQTPAAAGHRGNLRPGPRGTGSSAQAGDSRGTGSSAQSSSSKAPSAQDPRRRQQGRGDLLPAAEHEDLRLGLRPGAAGVRGPPPPAPGRGELGGARDPSTRGGR